MFGVDTGGSDVSAHREATSTLKLVLQKKRKLSSFVFYVVAFDPIKI